MCILVEKTPKTLGQRCTKVLPGFTFKQELFEIRQDHTFLKFFNYS